MGIFDNELILPGTSTEIISDYNLGYDMSDWGTTDSVTIIGTAFNGPVGKAVPVYSPEYANYVFGGSYDEATRREATLTAEIKDAWDRGCRTIYAVRISGKEIYKDFELIPETKLKLRVSGLFPSNANKDIYMVYDNTEGAETIKIYKPAERATIAEKQSGLVEDAKSVLVNKIDIANGFALTKDSRLIELINAVNNYSFNNVLKLTIVDEEGNDVTYSSKDAQALSIGAIFPGAYFIGRNANLGTAYTDVQYRFVQDDQKPYENFTDRVYKDLIINTDINSNYPIFAESKDEFNKKLPVAMLDMFDFLEIPGQVDKVFAKDKVDYEEVELSDFDIYQKLGKGYAITAKAEIYTDPVTREVKIKKVKETPTSDINRIQPINEGIYSMLENLISDYRVLTCGTADTVITGKLPKKSEFEIMTNKSIVLKDLVEVESIIPEKDFTDGKKYTFRIEAIQDAIDGVNLITDTYTDKTVKSASLASETEIGQTSGKPEGTLVLADTKVCRVTNGKLLEVDAESNTSMNGLLVFAQKITVTGEDADAVTTVADQLYKISVTDTNVSYAVATPADINNKKYIFVESDKTVYVYDATNLENLKPIGSVNEVFNDNEDKTLVTIQSQYATNNVITIKSTEFDYSTVEEFVEILNNDENLKKYFTFKLTSKGIINKDELVYDTFELGTKPFEAKMEIDRSKAYNTSLYIPYKTNDNFARQLAQHCTYTSLKTAPTHGVIGCNALKDTNLTSIANKVNTLLELDLNLVAKKENGKDMLDQNNLPYPIGRNVSIVLGQYTNTSVDNYSYISNGASGYAAMVSCLDLEQSSTNQPIDIPTPMYELTNYQLGKLTQKGIVTFKQSFTKGYVVTDGVTMAPVTSAFRRLSVTRISHAVEEAIRTATEPYIGKQNHLANRNAMQTAIKSGLEALKGTLIEAYSFNIQSDNKSAEKLGIVYIDYKIVPIYEIREVRNIISVGDTAE